MSAWLKSVLAELGGLSGNATDSAAFEPEEEITPEEHTVGVISEETRNLYVLFMKNLVWAREAENKLLILRGEARTEKFQEYARLRRRATALQEIFWMSCRHEFPELYVRSSIGIRNGWKIVWFEQEEKEQPPERPPSGIIFVPIGVRIRNQPPHTDDGNGSDKPPDKKGSGGDTRLN